MRSVTVFPSHFDGVQATQKREFVISVSSFQGAVRAPGQNKVGLSICPIHSTPFAFLYIRRTKREETCYISESDLSIRTINDYKTVTTLFCSSSDRTRGSYNILHRRGLNKRNQPQETNKSKKPAFGRLQPTIRSVFRLQLRGFMWIMTENHRQVVIGCTGNPLPRSLICYR